MKENVFNMENMRLGKKKSSIMLLQGEEGNFLGLKDINGNEITKIKILDISKIQKIKNFFMRAFNIYIEGENPESMLIPEEALMEAERKIIVQGEDAEERINTAVIMLKEKYAGGIHREEYQRTMMYLDTPNKELQENNMIFRLTQENNDVKSTIHMNNNLKGDKKHILKFFLTETSMLVVINFFREALSLTPITKKIQSRRTEYESSFGEVAIDKLQGKNAEYYVIELELDNFKDDKTHNSDKVDEAAKKIALELGLKDCEIVDIGTEAIHEYVTGENFFQTYAPNYPQIEAERANS